MRRQARKLDKDPPKPGEDEAVAKAMQAMMWVDCVLGTDLGGQDLHKSLSSGDVLCDLINKIKPGLVTRITRADACEGMSDTRRAAKYRDNLGRYLEACTFLGVRSGDLFTTVDLFEVCYSHHLHVCI